ncbi:uncharacterized protein MONOS_594 [Monocercomonoides exilis]|uniref:uncharacterized protein n=1 Tax=Monocercomonoides exilis TaxID=2049356 RepID=UPI003559D892|nr:hypothetical protein MONOS_594 [Monocercomonoides exilis]|eukprot:MONOS_594.1-p1 / transcript=MONOS_594.1 / gene=MONOS_594 / organism=Monocercomonoides_exilis_PA203 / gene_product=unspecified product / transcript_product=unspecified product / location=Mono_scaffold00009:217807-218849(+) / protein_length=325 / sequence_SO=supercontig / SO=protein_coding / is_pseudo=false
MLFPKLSPTWNFHKELEKLMNFCENSQEKREIRASGEIDRMIQRGLISEEEAEEWQRTLNIAAWPSKEIQRSLNSPSIPTSASVSTSSTSMMNERSVIESPYTGYEQLNDIFRQGVFSQSGWMACNSIAIQYLNGLSSAHHSNYMKKQKTQHNLITLLFPWITIIKDRMQTITNSNDSNLTGKQTDSEEDEISGEELFEDENRREPSHERRSRTISSVKHSDSMRLSVQHPESVSPGSCYLVESDKTFQPKQKGSQPYLPLFVVEVVSNEKEGSVLCKRFSMGYPRMKFPVASLLEINADYILHNEKRIQSSESKKWLKQQNIL